MNYPIDVELWKKLVEKYAIPFKEGAGRVYDLGHNQVVIVLSLDDEHDDLYGVGPTSMSFARYDCDNEKFMSLSYREDDGTPMKISYYDFRDVNAHNVGGHSGKITHWIDDWNLTCLMMDLLVIQKTGKK